MVAVVHRDVPTMEDARCAAEALVAAGAAEVWLYGSVARGEQHRGSDIDQGGAYYGSTAAA